MKIDDFEMDESATGLRDQSIWMGTDQRPVFARLTVPTTSTSRGGIVISPPIFRDARASRQALRELAFVLADDGFTVLRFDHFGTGDSGGDLDGDFLDTWNDQMVESVALLRSMGLSEISAVGMRLGATILVTAATRHSLNLSSIVLWDPCETGRAYLREMNAFETLRRQERSVDLGSGLATSEFVLSDEASASIRSLTILETPPEQVAPRVLILAREDRPVSSRFTTQYSTGSVTWEVTDEQHDVLEVELPSSVLPRRTVARIREWFQSSTDNVELSAAFDGAATSPTAAGDGPTLYREHAITVAPRALFAMVCEPVSAPRGPWMVMINGINEDHVGPARIWVDLSRRWASYGLRCVRFDFAGLGESERLDASMREAAKNTPLEDIRSVVSALSHDDPTNVVFVGICTGAQKALEIAESLGSRGVCTINPQVGKSIQQATDRLASSDAGLLGAFVLRTKKYVERHRWMGQLIWQGARVFLPSAYSLKVRRTLADHGTEMLLIVSPEDFNPFPRVPVLRSLDKRRLLSTEMCRIEVVPGLDHDFFNIAGRLRAIEILDSFVHEKFVRGDAAH